MSKYLFIKGFFDTVDLFTDEIIAFLEERGDKCLCLNKTNLDKELKAFYKSLKDEKPDMAIVFNNIGYSLGEEEGGNIWDRLDIPFVDILMDHPFHFHPILINLPKNAGVFCIDKNHVEFVKRYYPQIQHVDFMPHGGCKHLIEALPDASDRDIDILYAGNLSRVLIEKLIPDFESFRDFDGAAFSQMVLGTLIENPECTTEDVIREELSALGLSPTKEEELYYINAFRFTDGFAASFYREIAVRILTENGFKVHVLGEGWAGCEWKNENLICHGKVPAREVLSFMKRSKIVLNTLTWFKEGSHDRIINGMLSGAAVITDTSGYLTKEFKDGEDISFFNLREIDRLPYIADRLLSDEEYRRSITCRAYEKAREYHGFGKRIEDL